MLPGCLCYGGSRGHLCAVLIAADCNIRVSYSLGTRGEVLSGFNVLTQYQLLAIMMEQSVDLVPSKTLRIEAGSHISLQD